jgi:phenylacetic acid degradation operon negative regulatory protein
MKSKEIVVKATDGLIRNATNGILWWLFLVGAGIGKSNSSYGVYRMFREADEALTDFNYNNFKQLIRKMQQDGFIIKKRRYTNLEIEITEIGKKRIASLFPIYRTQRHWDGYLYLISYDIPESRRASRDLLRRYLIKIGCALLQESLWITPYSPRMLINDFMEAHYIQGTVLLSKLGRNGAIGEEELKEMLERIYNLRELNIRYSQFLLHVRRKKCIKFSYAVEFQRIVSDDPQLPFELLPNNWKGNEAYTAYSNIYK